MGSVRCVKLKILTMFKPPSQSLLNADGRIEQIILRFCPNSLQYNQPHAPFHYRFGVMVQIVTSIWSVFRILNMVEES